MNAGVPDGVGKRVRSLTEAEFPVIVRDMPAVALGKSPASSKIGNPGSEVRERLTDAVTRAATEGGYPAVDVAQIARYAGLSVEDFERHFDGKEQCLLAAHDRFVERMLEHIDAACEEAEDWPYKVKLAIEAAFDFVAELEAVARIFVVDAVGSGPAEVDRRCASIDRAALHLKHGRLLYPATADLPDAMERTLVAGVVMTASIQLLDEDASRLPEFGSEAVEMVLTPYVGTRRARRIAAA